MFLIVNPYRRKAALATSTRDDNTTCRRDYPSAEAVDYISRTIAQLEKGERVAGKSTAHAATNKASGFLLSWRELNTGESYVSRRPSYAYRASTHAYSTLSDYIAQAKQKGLNFLRSPIMARIWKMRRITALH